MFNRLNNLTINHKLWMTAIVMVIIGVVITGVSYSRLTKLDSSIGYIVNEGLPATIAPKDIQSLIKGSYAHINLYLLNHDKHYKTLYTQNIESAQRLLDEQFVAHQNHLKHPGHPGHEEHEDEGTALVAEVKVVLQQLIQLNREMIALTESENRANKKGDMDRLLKTASPLQDKLSNLIDELAKHENDHIAKVSQMLLDEAGNSLNTIIYGIPLGTLFLILFVGFLNRTIVIRLNAAVIAMQDVAMKGDLNLRLDETGKDEITALSLAYNTFMVKIQGVVDLVLSSSSSLSEESTSLNAMTQNAESQAEKQKVNIGEISVSINDMASRVELVASNASAAAESAQQANEDARTGKDIVSEVVSSITDLSDEVSKTSTVIAKLGEDSKEITSVVSIIRGISEQTNLLALNAAIEAARAGEAGRGFAVVADEVRTLSERIHSETDEIQRKIDSLQTASIDAVNAMEKGAAMSQKSVDMAQNAGQALESITESVRTISEMNIGIADLTKSQKESAAEVHSKTEMVGTIASESAETSAQVSRVSQEFTIMSSQLKDLVEQFLLASGTDNGVGQSSSSQLTAASTGASSQSASNSPKNLRQ